MSVASRRRSLLSLSATLQRREGLPWTTGGTKRFTVERMRRLIRGEEGDEGLECFRAGLAEEEVALAIAEAEAAVGLLDRGRRKLVEAMCALPWWRMSGEVRSAFRRWTMNLLTAHVYHAPLAIAAIISRFVEVDDSGEVDAAVFSPLHGLLAEIVSTIPLCADVVVKCAADNFPYYKRGRSANLGYVHNLLRMTAYLPSMTESLVTIVVDRLITLDVNVERDDGRPPGEDGDVFAMEADAPIDSLDACMTEMFRWIDRRECDAAAVLMKVFERTLLPTFGTRNVQFLLLYALREDRAKSNRFLEFLWRIVESARVGPDLRRSAVAYLGGFLARANYLPPGLLNFYAERMANWCLSYIEAQDSMRFARYEDCGNPHVVFYSVCQTLFYLLAFKHRHFFSGKSAVAFVDSLGLSKIVHSSLNPLRMCLPTVVDYFASVTRLHQIVYCHAVIEHNMRNYVRSSAEVIKHSEWFPFDSYMLPESSIYTRPLYAEYEDAPIENARNIDKICDEDDFLAKSPHSDLPGSLPKFSLSNFKNHNT